MYTSTTEISTSAAVSELRLVYGLVLLMFSLLNFTILGLCVLLLVDCDRNSSIESNAVFAFTTGWIIVIELALFLGILISAFVVLNSVLAILRFTDAFAKFELPVAAQISGVLKFCTSGAVSCFLGFEVKSQDQDELDLFLALNFTISHFHRSPTVPTHPFEAIFLSNNFWYNFRI
jgi:multisubunit Na+/H+ antiporter MnhG subunit